MLRRPILLSAVTCFAAFFVGAWLISCAQVEVQCKFGWAGRTGANAAYERARHVLPKFAIAGDVADDPSRPAYLWTIPRILYGEHIPPLQQPAEDCVGASSAQAVQYLMAQGGEYVPLFPPYSFSCGRNAPECGHGRLGRNPAGSYGIDQARAVQIYGVLEKSFPGLPPYDERHTNEWAVRMPDKQYVEAGRQHVVKTIARVNTTDDARRVLQNYYVFTIASDWGGIDRGPGAGAERYVCPIVDGMRTNRRASTWPHQMLVVGYRQVAGRGKFYVLNNWGAAAHGAPAGDEPPGGFWIDEADLRYILEQGDSWAYSDAVGFPARPLDFNIVRATRRDAERPRLNGLWPRVTIVPRPRAVHPRYGDLAL